MLSGMGARRQWDLGLGERLVASVVVAAFVAAWGLLLVALLR